MNSICVFCGSQSGRHAGYEESARRFGSILATRGLRLIYGGGRLGLMGSLAQAVLDNGGEVIGVVPNFFTNRDVIHKDLSESHIVADLFERKSVMLELADAFVALPGGLGTADELLEVVTWKQLRQLDKPIGILNVESYFDPWCAAIEHAISEGFAASHHISEIIVESDPDVLLSRLGVATKAADQGTK